MSVSRWMDEILGGLTRCDGARTLQAKGISMSCDGSGLGGALLLDAAGHPVARARFPMYAGTEALVTNEFEVLTRLQGASESVAKCISAPLGLVNATEGPVAYYPYVPGRTVKQSDVLADDEFSGEVAVWLADMHSYLGHDRTLDQQSFDEWVTNPVEAAVAKSAIPREYREALERAMAVASGIVGETVPAGIAHRDLWCDNALRGQDGGFVAIDWSMSVMNGLPVFDLLYWHFFNAGIWSSVDMIAGADMCLRSDQTYRRAFSEALSRYCNRIGWRPDNPGAWMVAFVIHTFAIRLAQAGAICLPARNYDWIMEVDRIRELGDELASMMHTDTEAARLA